MNKLVECNISANLTLLLPLDWALVSLASGVRGSRHVRRCGKAEQLFSPIFFFEVSMISVLWSFVSNEPCRAVVPRSFEPENAPRKCPEAMFARIFFFVLPLLNTVELADVSLALVDQTT